MNVNFVYSDFAENGRDIANLAKAYPQFQWWDSSNFFSSYLNDQENNFSYWDDKTKFNVVKHPLKSILNNPSEVYFYMISHPGLCYNELSELPNLGISSQIIKRLKTNKNFYLVYLQEHEADSLSGLNTIVDKLNRLGIDNKTIIVNNNSRIDENLAEIKKIHNFDTKVRVYKINFLTWSTFQVLAFENDDYKAYPFKWNEEKTGKFFMCRNKGGKPHRMGMLAFIRANKNIEEHTNYSFIGTALYGDLIRKMNTFFTPEFILDNAKEIFELDGFYKEDDYEAGKNWIDTRSGQFIHKGLAPIYQVPELHEAFSNSYMNIVTESGFLSEEKVTHISEKSFRPFYYYQYSMYLAAPYHVQQLREYGFDMFDDIIDHSYDLIEDDGLRFKAFTSELIRIENIKEDFTKMYSDHKDRFYKNKETFIKLANKVKIQDIEFFRGVINEYKSNIANIPII